MRRFATFWAVTGSFLMLCLLGGASDWAQDSEKALRNQRSRSTRNTRLDADHDAYDHSGDLLSGSNASNLSWQSNPWQPVSPAIAAMPMPLLPGFITWEPVAAFRPLIKTGFLQRSSSGRSPPVVLL